MESSLKISQNITSRLVPIGRGLAGLRNCSGVDEAFREKLNGSIACFTPLDGCTIAHQINFVQNYGAIAAVVFAESGWFCARNKQASRERELIKIPTFFAKRSIMSENLLEHMYKDKSITVFLTPSKNDLDKLNDGAIIFFQVIIIGTNILAILCVFLKFFFLIISKEFCVNFQEAILFFALIGNLISIMFMIDPFGIHKKIISYEYLVILYFKMFFQDVGMMLISFYYIHILRRFLYRAFYFFSLLIVMALIGAMMAVLFTEIVFYLTYSLRELILYNFVILEVSIYGFLVLYYVIGSFVLLFSLHRISRNISDNEKIKSKEYIKINVCAFVFGAINISIFILYAFDLNDKIYGLAVYRIIKHFSLCFLNGLTGITLFFLFTTSKERKKNAKKQLRVNQRTNTFNL